MRIKDLLLVKPALDRTLGTPVGLLRCLLLGDVPDCVANAIKIYQASHKQITESSNKENTKIIDEEKNKFEGTKEELEKHLSKLSTEKEAIYYEKIRLLGEEEVALKGIALWKLLGMKLLPSDLAALRQIGVVR